MLIVNFCPNVRRLIIKIMRFSYLLGWLLIFSGTTILVACMQAAPLQKSDNLIATISKTPGDTNSAWEVELYVTGGFAGVRKNIRISSSGEMVVRDEEKNKPIALNVQQTDLERVSKFVKAIERLPQVSKSSSCVDCFQYELDILIEDSHFHASYDDENLNQSGLKPLIFELVRIMDSALDK